MYAVFYGLLRALLANCHLEYVASSSIKHVDFPVFSRLLGASQGGYECTLLPSHQGDELYGVPGCVSAGRGPNIERVPHQRQG